MDLVVTHEAPELLSKVILMGTGALCKQSAYFQQIAGKLSFRRWYFGHITVTLIMKRMVNDSEAQSQSVSLSYINRSYWLLLELPTTRAQGSIVKLAAPLSGIPWALDYITQKFNNVKIAAGNKKYSRFPVAKTYLARGADGSILPCPGCGYLGYNAKSPAAILPSGR